ncbi:MAG: hypothetical protein ABJB12_16075 [Pseudomonadota bacterium]
MDPFQRCVEDLGSIDRLLELPHGKDIALEMFRELAPYMAELTPLKDRDPSGAVALLFEYAHGVRMRLGATPFESGLQPAMKPPARVA